jgi:hypothetical protein
MDGKSGEDREEMTAWIPLSPSEDITLPFKFKRKQFPIRTTCS